jgi:hypothetical protein
MLPPATTCPTRPGPQRATARNPVLDEVLASRRAADAAAIALCVEAMQVQPQPQSQQPTTEAL